MLPKAISQVLRTPWDRALVAEFAMKITYISNSDIPSVTANSLHVMKACRSLAKLGHEVVLMCPDYQKEEKPIEDEGNIFDFYNVEPVFSIRRIKVPAIKGKTILYVISILILMLRLRPQLIYSRFLLGSFIPLLFIKGFFESHSPVWLEGRLSKWLFRGLMKFGRKWSLVVITHSLKVAYQKAYPDLNNVIVAPDGADPISLPRSISSVFLRGHSDRLQVGYTGHLYEGKGMEIISAIADNADQCEFHIVGGAEQDIQFWKRKISAQNVHFYGFHGQKTVDAFIDKFDVCLLPNQQIVRANGFQSCETQSEAGNIGSYTSPLKMFQYMAHGKPIIASDLPVLREILNEKNCVLVSPHIPEQWISALEDLADAGLRQHYGRNAFSDFIEKYTWDKRMQSIIMSMESNLGCEY